MTLDVERESQKLHKKLLKVFGNEEKAFDWYFGPHKELRGHSPCYYLEHGGDLETIHKLLDQIRR